MDHEETFELCPECEDFLYDGVCLSCEGEVFSFGPEHYASFDSGDWDEWS